MGWSFPSLAMGLGPVFHAGWVDTSEVMILYWE